MFWKLGSGWRSGIILASGVSDPGSIPGPGNQRLLWGLLHASDKRAQVMWIHPDFETHGQSHPKFETEGTNGPTKWTSVQQKLQKKQNKNMSWKF